MSILKAIKAWWKPEPDPKIRVRFNRHGHIAMIYYPARYSHTEIGMMAQEVDCYKIKIGQTEQYSGLLGQSCSFNKSMLAGYVEKTAQQLQAEAFNKLITGGVRVQ